jgi:hypothetical protein
MGTILVLSSSDIDGDDRLFSGDDFAFLRNAFVAFFRRTRDGDASGTNLMGNSFTDKN